MKAKHKFFKVRDYNHDTDFAYVCDSYIRALRRCDGYDSLPTDVFYDSFRKKAEESTQAFDCVVACLSGEECGEDSNDFIFGFMQYLPIDESGNFVCGFAYVRDTYRHNGVFESMYDFASEGRGNAKKVMISFGNNGITDSIIRRNWYVTRIPEFLFFDDSYTTEEVDKVIASAAKTIDRRRLLLNNANESEC